jgi:hypothetical protein
MHNKIHLHSIVVHAVYAMVLMATGAFVVAACTSSPVLGLRPGLWDLLVKGSLILTLATLVPATISGVLERNHRYANWHRTHRFKLVYSLLLLVLVALEIVMLISSSDPYHLASALAAAVVIANPVIAMALGIWGFKITLGRQALGRTSYVADARKTPPVDILNETAEYLSKHAKRLDILDEGSR